MQAKIAVLPGDGIGPDVAQEAIAVLDAIAERFGHGFEYEYGLVGGAAIDASGTALPSDTLKLVRASDTVLLGAVGGPKWDDPRASVRPEQGLLGLRKALGLFANLRPVKLMPMLQNATTLKEDTVAGTDLVVVRELTGGLYFGKPSKRYDANGSRKAVDTLRYSEEEVRRVMRVGFDLARTRRKKVTSVDKQNVLSSSRLWREVATEIGAEYPDVNLEHMLVDTCAMQLIRRPTQFDVIVTENMFGDILTDEASTLAGSMGMLPSASLGYDRSHPDSPSRGPNREIRPGMYEPIHGSAPKYAGKNVANPIATILSAALMLRYSLHLAREADLIEDAVLAVLREGYRCNDIQEDGCKLVGTREMGALITTKVKGVG